jgi:molybdate transport repressor ModE-like protein
MEPDVWLRVELRHLAALRAVSREGSLAAAATSLGYTQSAVSQQIAMLERIVGARVLERRGGRRPAVLTDVGRVLLGHSEAIVARLNAARADVAAIVAGEAGVLRVGAYQSVGTYILPRLLRGFRQSWPQVEIALQQEPGDRELLRLVSEGELDLCFVTLPAATGSFATVELFRDPYVLVVAADSPLAARRKMTLTELKDTALIAFRSCSHQPLIEAHLRAGGVEPRIVFTSDDNGMIQSLVAAGMGTAIVPRLTMDQHDRATAIIELGGRLPPRILALVWHRDRYQSPAVTAFIGAARRAFAELAAQQTTGPAIAPGSPGTGWPDGSELDGFPRVP